MYYWTQSIMSTTKLNIWSADNDDRPEAPNWRTGFDPLVPPEYTLSQSPETVWLSIAPIY